jgi:putative two-component system response regulator
MVTGQGRILIVDDEELVRRSLRKKLSRGGYYCEEASSGDEALKLLRNAPAELVILDIRMPGKSGREVLPEIRTSYPETAVIMATAVTETSVVIDCMKEGAQDYIPKPFNLGEVMSSVERVLDKRELALEIKKHQQSLETKVEEQTGEIRSLFLGAIEALVFALEAKDKYTAGHSRRVTEIAVAIGEQMGLPQDELDNLRWGALLHDIGKIAVDPQVQNKPGKLTPEEYRHIMVHAQVGPDIVRPVVNENIIAIIRHHHDRLDGNGLNQTVRGEDIPLGARILAVADTFDALTSDRPYRAAMSTEEALAEIKRCSGTQFDPTVVDALLHTPVADIVLAQSRIS